MEKNLIIVGKSSYVGRYLTKYTMSRGMNIISLSSKDYDFLKLNEVTNFFNSLSDIGYTIIFLAVINKSGANSFQSFINNIRMVNNLIKGQKLANIELIIYFSSIDVYGKKPVLPITEQTIINPDSWYSLAKFVCEWILSSSGEVHCPVTTLRLPGIYGFSQKDNSVIGKMVASIRNEKRVIIKGNGKVLRDYVYIKDLCELVQQLIPLKYHGILNVATGKSYTILEISKMICSILRKETEIIFEAADEERSFDLKFDIRTLFSLIPNFRFSNMANGIQSYI